MGLERPTIKDMAALKQENMTVSIFLDLLGPLSILKALVTSYLMQYLVQTEYMDRRTDFLPYQGETSKGGREPPLTHITK